VVLHYRLEGPPRKVELPALGEDHASLKLGTRAWFAV